MIKCINRIPKDNLDQEIPCFSFPSMPPLQPGPRGVSIQILVRSADTDYQYTCVETALAPRTLGPSPHVHERLDELSLVVEGTLSVKVEDTVYESQVGGMVFRPRGKVHTFWNATDQPVRFFDMFLNQNFDEYLEEFFRLIGGGAGDDSGISIEERVDAMDREFEVVQFHDQRASIIQQYGLIG